MDVMGVFVSHVNVAHGSLSARAHTHLQVGRDRGKRKFPFLSFLAMSVNDILVKGHFNGNISTNTVLCLAMSNNTKLCVVGMSL